MLPCFTSACIPSEKAKFRTDGSIEGLRFPGKIAESVFFVTYSQYCRSEPVSKLALPKFAEITRALPKFCEPLLHVLSCWEVLLVRKFATLPLPRCRNSGFNKIFRWVKTVVLSMYLSPFSPETLFVAPTDCVTFVWTLFSRADKIMNLGNKLLVYVSCGLAGVAYPHGFIDPESSASMKQQVRGRIYFCGNLDIRARFHP